MSRIMATSLIAFGLAASAYGQTPLEAALAVSTDGPIYSYDLTFQDNEINASGRLDPSQPEGQRIQVDTPAEADWDDDFREAIAKMEADTEGDIWCSSLAENIPADATLEEETETSAIYSFTPQASLDEPDEGKFFSKLKGRVTIDKINPAILAFQMVSLAPFKPVPIAKVSAFEMKVSCARSPDGRTYGETMEMNVSGSAMFQKFEEFERRQISNLKEVLPTPQN